jgi:hypothetical protein
MIRWILNYLIFAGTFFAAGATTVGGGGGATPPPTGGDSGAAGGSKVIPSGPGAGDGSGTTGGAGDATAGASTDAGDDFGDVGDFDTEDADATTQTAGSTEEFGSETYKTVKEALKDKPEVFKQVKKAVSMVKRYMEHFETPEKAGELLSSLQTLGGLEGIQQEMGESATFLNAWNAGDKEPVLAWLKENSEGLAKNMPTVMSHWFEADPQGWGREVCGTFEATMLQPNKETGISPIAALQQLAAIEGVKDSPAYKSIMAMVENIRKQAAQAPQVTTAKGPDETKLSAREQAVARQEQENRKQALGGKAAPVLRTAAENALKIVAGSRKLSPQPRSDLLKDIHGEFARLLKADKVGESNRMKLLAAGQVDQWLKMVKSAADRTMPLAARRVWRKYAGISGLSSEQKADRKAEAQGQREAGTGSTSNAAPETKHPGDGRQVDKEAMIRKFGSRNKAEDAFLWGIPETGGKKTWIEKGTGKIYIY